MRRLVVAALSPHHACQQPILRAADTAVGIAVGLGAASIGTWVAVRRNPSGATRGLIYSRPAAKCSTIRSAYQVGHGAPGLAAV